METSFTWDAAKARRNKREHGISFEMAREAFADPNHVVT
ncbi:MAG TPA: BrnT family toxin [Bryobacteraceae bacterium]|nr:BrnT family toxin [Bryobacteraceae bacterium]